MILKHGPEAVSHCIFIVNDSDSTDACRIALSRVSLFGVVLYVIRLEYHRSLPVERIIIVYAQGLIISDYLYSTSYVEVVSKIQAPRVYKPHLGALSEFHPQA